MKSLECCLDIFVMINRKSVSLVSAKIIHAVVGFVFPIAIVSSFDENDSANILHLFASLIMISAVLRCGLDSIVLRLSSGKMSCLDLRLENAAFIFVFFASVAFCSIIYLGSLLFGPIGLVSTELSIYFMLLIVPYSTIVLKYNYYWGRESYFLSACSQGLLVQGGLLFWLYLTGENLADVDHMFWFLVVVLNSVFLLYFFSTLSKGMLEFRNILSDFSILWDGAKVLWPASISTTVVGWLGGVAIPLFASQKDTAIYNVALRVSFSIGFLLVIANMYLAPRFSKMWKNEDPDGVVALYRKSAGVLAVVSIFGCLFILGFFQLFLKDYLDISQREVFIAYILIVAQAVSVAFGPVGYLLTMTGHLKEYRDSVVVAGLSTVVATFMLGSYLGAVGVASAAFIGISLQNYLSYSAVRKIFL